MSQVPPGSGPWGKALGTGRAAPNIALIKYWGKRVPELNLPDADSLSLTLDGPFLTARVHAGRTRDRVFWIREGRVRELGDELMEPYLRVLARARELARGAGAAALELVVDSPLAPARGFASSAAAMAAISLALDQALELNLDEAGLSRLARLGSGSACRSIPGGLVRWFAGTGDQDSRAQTILGPEHWPELRLVLISLEQGPKAVSSTRGMIRTRETSPLYPLWIRRCREMIGPMISAFEQRDLTALGKLAEENAGLMHAAALAAGPPLIYMTPGTAGFLERLYQARARGLEAWFTLDAGPNPIILTEARQVEGVISLVDPERGELFSVHGIGPAARRLKP